MSPLLRRLVLVLCGAGFLVVQLSLGGVAQAAAVKVVVSNDDWIFTNTGFAAAPDTDVFAANLATFLCGGSSGTIHAYSSHFGVTQSVLSSTLANAGFTFSTGTSFPITSTNLAAFDAIMLSPRVLTSDEVQAILDYVLNGGGLYIYGGTSSTPAPVASRVNLLINTFGVNMEPTLYSGAGVISIASATDPIFSGVAGLYHDRGNPLTGAGLQVPYGQPGQALFAVIRELGSVAVEQKKWTEVKGLFR